MFLAGSSTGCWNVVFFLCLYHVVSGCLERSVVSALAVYEMLSGKRLLEKVCCVCLDVLSVILRWEIIWKGALYLA